MTFADPCTGARTTEYRSGADSPRGLDHGQSDGARVPPRWSGHRGRLVAPDESARSCKATPLWAVARRSRYVPLRFTSRDLRRASQEPHERGTGGDGAPGGARGWRDPLRTLRGPVPRAVQSRLARPALGRAPLRRRGCASRRSTSRCQTLSPVSAPKGLGLISDPTLRPAPPARRLMRTAGSETWLRVGISSVGKKSRFAKGTLESNASRVLGT